MVDLDTFLTTLYVMVDDFYKSEPPAAREPGPVPSLIQGKVVTLDLLGHGLAGTHAWAGTMAFVF